jgi:hypothetical protein
VRVEAIYKMGACLLLDGVLFPDGRYQKYARTAQTPHIVQLATERFPVLDETRTTTLCESVNVVVEAVGIKAVAGGTSWGSEGFVACEGLQGDLKWIALFETSNPFHKIVWDGDCIVATSTYGHS